MERTGHNEQGIKGVMENTEEAGDSLVCVLRLVNFRRQ